LVKIAQANGGEEGRKEKRNGSSGGGKGLAGLQCGLKYQNSAKTTNTANYVFLRKNVRTRRGSSNRNVRRGDTQPDGKLTGRGCQ